jgi:Stress responsive A/B Barrel Domain
MSSPRLAHNVFFKLNDAATSSSTFAGAACHKYLNVQPGIVFFAAGPLCAELVREVNDRDWHVGLHLVFDTKASHDAYQDDPMHVRFITEMKPNWAGVRVFDSYV